MSQLPVMRSKLILLPPVAKIEVFRWKILYVAFTVDEKYHAGRCCRHVYPNLTVQYVVLFLFLFYSNLLKLSSFAYSGPIKKKLTISLTLILANYLYELIHGNYIFLLLMYINFIRPILDCLSK